MFSWTLDPEPATGGLGIAFSDRLGGVSAGAFGPLNLGRSDVDDLGDLRENFARVRRALGVNKIITVAQIHGADVLTVDADLVDGWGPDQELGSLATGVRLTEADAMVTRERGVALCIRVADCLPVIFADHARSVIGAAHAGRVGLAGGVLPATVRAMRDLGAEGPLEAWLGPHICGECYEVPATMQADVASGLPGAASTTSWGTPALDLGAAAARQLEDAGCLVHRHDPCTFTDEQLHSHRREGAGAGRLGAFVWLR